MDDATLSAIERTHAKPHPREFCDTCSLVAVLREERKRTAMRGRVMSYERAWRIESDDTPEYGVLVECGPNEHPYWWVLCPATSTLYIDEVSGGCSDASCMWNDVHANADALWCELQNAKARATAVLPVPEREQ